jgi:hypothetical protein
MRQFVDRAVIPALLTRLRRDHDQDPVTLRVFVTVEWRVTWHGMTPSGPYYC